MQNIVKWLLYIIFMIFGGLLGYSFSEHTRSFFSVGLTSGGLIANTLAMIMLGIFVGYIMAPACTWLMVKAIDSLAKTLQSIPVQEVLMGAIGLLFGLILAFFINLALQTVSFSAIPVVGVYLGPLCVVMITLFLGTMGAYVGSRVVFIHNFKKVLSAGVQGQYLSQRVILLDTSVVIDGRISAVRESGFLEGILLVPRFVLHELQTLADSENNLKRNRGRRGLDLLSNMRKNHEIEVTDREYNEHGVDGKLIRMALDMHACLCTTDYNLAKVAAVQGVTVLNINQLTNALKPVVIAGEILTITIIKEGKESGQGVGYLDDGTMVVVEEGRRYVGETVKAEVNSVVQTAAGRMFFARYRSSAEKQ
ncbi:TRAM domain-containing protein [bacterium]|nr:TRAM domain-containing protein [bacterium]